MKVYVLQFNMFDGDNDFDFIEVYDTKEKAQHRLCELVEEYKEFWQDFSIIDKDEKELCAYDEGCYDDAHIEIYIQEKEIE